MRFDFDSVMEFLLGCVIIFVVTVIATCIFGAIFLSKPTGKCYIDGNVGGINANYVVYQEISWLPDEPIGSAPTPDEAIGSAPTPDEAIELKAKICAVK